MHLYTLSDWLAFIGSVHKVEIDLGLDRVKQVAKKLRVLSLPCPIIMVGGTNGKGSTVAGLEAIYQAAGFRVGCFTSPILFQHNEQVRINGKMAADEEFCQAFEKIETAREKISLTPFEYHTLAALLIFQSYVLDVVILEVGLGGRLDAVNIMDADIAVITSIGIDHVQWLGNTREAIAYEKAGIFRPQKPAICGDVDVPMALKEIASQQKTPLFCQGRDFSYQENENDWSFTTQDKQYTHLPLSSLATQNMASVLMVVHLLQSRLPVNRKAIDQGLSTVSLRGRLQMKTGDITEINDVSHNPAAVAWLSKKIKTVAKTGITHAVFSMLADKDILECIKIISPDIDHWYVAPLKVNRAASLEQLQNTFAQANLSNVMYFSSIPAAYRHAKKQAEKGDTIVVFGSFHTLAQLKP